MQHWPNKGNQHSGGFCVSEFPLLASIDMIYIINLVFRADRRAEMTEQLARVGLSFDHPKVQLFTASRPDDPGEFPNIGSRGCFQSHLGILKDALARGFDTILVLEDDADFTNRFCKSTAQEALTIQSEPWDMFYFGTIYGPEETEAFFAPVSPEAPLKLTHATMLRKSAITRMVPYLETMLSRKLGDPAGGPMHLDGAYSWFRRENPDITTMATTGQWIIQRSSKTDIHDTGWKERLPLIGWARRLKNSLTRH